MMDEQIQQSPFSPYIIHEISEDDVNRYRDSPTQSILKTPTAVFARAEDLHKTGKRLTFAESPIVCDRDSITPPISTPKKNIENGEKSTPAVKVAISPTKAVKVSPEAWKAYKTYQRCYQDYPNETEKTDYTYSRLSPFHQREIIPGIPMRPNMSRPALKSCYSVPLPSMTTPVSKRTKAVTTSDSIVNAFNERLEIWRRQKFFIRNRKFSLENEDKGNIWWWIILILFVLFGFWMGYKFFFHYKINKDYSLIANDGSRELMERVTLLELTMAEEFNRKRNNSIARLLDVLQMSRANLLSSYRRCCRSLQRIMLRNLSNIEKHLNESYQNSLILLTNKLEDSLQQLIKNWTLETKEMRDHLLSFNGQPQQLSIQRIVDDAIRIYDSDKTARADFALESSGGRVASIRCTQPWPGDKDNVSFDPHIAIRKDVAPGQCWAFQGEGRLVLELSHPIFVTGCSIEHIPSSIHPHGRIASAPNNFTLWGLKSEEDDAPHFFGQYIYKIGKDNETIQYFKVVNPAANVFKYVELVITSNHGHPYTCLYRVRIHGAPE